MNEKWCPFCADYSNFEKSTNPILAEKMMERSREYMKARRVAKEYEAVIRGLNKTAPCVPPTGQYYHISINLILSPSINQQTWPLGGHSSWYIFSKLPLPLLKSQIKDHFYGDTSQIKVIHLCLGHYLRSTGLLDY